MKPGAYPQFALIRRMRTPQSGQEPSTLTRCRKRMRMPRRRALVLRATVFLVVSSIVVLTASPVLAKGPSQAELEGPGLTSPLLLRPTSQRTIGQALATMVQESGFFDGLYGTGPDSRTTRPPNSKLGPRFTVTYTLGGPAGDSTIVQNLYPYAAPGPVTHIPPDQPFWIDHKTAGGWHVAGAELKHMLIEVGLPRTSLTIKEETNENNGGAHEPTVIYAAVASLFILSAVVKGRRLRRAFRLAS